MRAIRSGTMVVNGAIDGAVAELSSSALNVRCLLVVLSAHPPFSFDFHDFAKVIFSFAARMRTEPRERFNSAAIFEMVSPA